MNKYKIAITKKFKKDLKTAKIRGYDLNLIQQVVDTIASGKKLDEKYKFVSYYLTQEKMKELGIEKDDTNSTSEMLLKIE